MAFNTAGFNTSTISPIDIYFFPTTDRFYNVSDYYLGIPSSDEPLLTTTRSIDETLVIISQLSNFRNLLDLLSSLSPLPGSETTPIHGGQFNIRESFGPITELFFTSAPIEKRIDLVYDFGINEAGRIYLDHYNARINALYDVLLRTALSDAPGFAIVDFSFFHVRWVFDEFGNFNPNDARSNLERYHGHHMFGIKVLMRFIDLILEYDPDAVIVLQADHGLHTVPAELSAEFFGCSLEEAELLWSSVMSAVRLPDYLLSLEAESILSDPRNISRFLINNFIGKNYEYVPTEAP